MAIPEACSLWIEQRIKEELESQEEPGLTHREIGRRIASEIEKIFESKVNPETIRKRVDRISGTNVPHKKNSVKTSDNVDLEKLEKPNHGGARQGAGRKPAATTTEVSIASQAQRVVTPGNPQQVVERIVSLRKQLSSEFENMNKLIKSKALTDDRCLCEIGNHLQLLVDEAADLLGIFIHALAEPAREAA